MLPLRLLKRAFIAILFLLTTALILPQPSFATEQAGESVIYEGKEYGIDEYPFYSYLESQKPPLNFDMLDTAHWRGYQASWKVKEGVLFLTSLEARLKGKDVKVSDVFPSSASFPVKATWYSGRLTVNVGESQGYWHEKILSLKDGTILSVEDLKHKLRPVLPINAINRWGTVLFAPIVFFMLGFFIRQKKEIKDRMLIGVKLIISIMLAQVFANLAYAVIDLIYTTPGYYLDKIYGLKVETETLRQRLPSSLLLFAVSSIVPIIISVGMILLKNWARIVLICVTGLMLVVNLATLITTRFIPIKFDLIQIAIIIFCSSCLIYLFQPKVKAIFK